MRFIYFSDLFITQSLWRKSNVNKRTLTLLQLLTTQLLPAATGRKIKYFYTKVEERREKPNIILQPTRLIGLWKREVAPTLASAVTESSQTKQRSSVRLCVPQNYVTIISSCMMFHDSLRNGLISHKKRLMKYLTAIFCYLMAGFRGDRAKLFF